MKNTPQNFLPLRSSLWPWPPTGPSQLPGHQAWSFCPASALSLLLDCSSIDTDTQHTHPPDSGRSLSSVPPPPPTHLGPPARLSRPSALLSLPQAWWLTVLPALAWVPPPLRVVIVPIARGLCHVPSWWAISFTSELFTPVPSIAAARGSPRVKGGSPGTLP